MWALAGWLCWLEHCPVHQNIGGSIPSHGTHRGCGFGPRWVFIREATSPCFSLSRPKNQYKYPRVRIKNKVHVRSCTFPLVSCQMVINGVKKNQDKGLGLQGGDRGCPSYTRKAALSHPNLFRSILFQRKWQTQFSLVMKGERTSWTIQKRPWA